MLWRILCVTFEALQHVVILVLGAAAGARLVV
jgi:hypothetical protein